jgi:hypothetical protein
MKHEWKEFGKEHEAPSVRAPAHLGQAILGSVRADLKPSFTWVLAKLGLIHALVSIGTLSICPQFGIRLFGEGMGIMHWFIAFGSIGCPLACGIFFVGSSLALSATVLARPEWRAIREHHVLAVTALVLLSLGFFKIMDGEFFLDFSLAWLAGALLAGGAMVEGVWRLYELSAERV